MESFLYEKQTSKNSHELQIVPAEAHKFIYV